MVQEWVQGLSGIQSEEVRRVGEFAYQRDAKYALVGITFYTPIDVKQYGLGGHLKMGTNVFHVL